MKTKILKALMESDTEFVSGQSLCGMLGVTRQAVWKNIIQLKEAGFEIESVTNKGYRLVKTPDKLYAPYIESMLKSECVCDSVQCFETIDSTNIKAKQLAEAGEKEGSLIVADKQTAGRGRRGRSWDSKSGTGIFMSLILRPDIPPVNVSGITLVAAMAIARAIENVCVIKAQIKWPNDIVLGKKKICGILTEMSSEMNYVHYAVVGIGINVNNEKFDEKIEDTATSIYLETGVRVDRDRLAAEIMNCFDVYYRRFIESKGLEPLVEEYNSMLANLDKEVKVLFGLAEDYDEDKAKCGIARGIDKDGALIVETKLETLHVVSGEVSVRGLYGYV